MYRVKVSLMIVIKKEFVLYVNRKWFVWGCFNK